MSQVLSVEGISKTYEKSSIPALFDFSLTIEQGKIVALVGASGSGKSTLLNIVAGKLAPSTGKVRLLGDLLPDPSQLLIKEYDGMHIIRQDFELLPRHTVSQNIKRPLRRYEVSYQEDRLAELIKLLQLEGLEDKLAIDLSGGQQQRVAIARALALNPSMLLMDEPFNQIDQHLKIKLKNEIRTLISEIDAGAIIVTHDPHDALSLADQIVVLREGKSIAHGDPRDVYLRPGSRYTANLFGPMQIFSQHQLSQWFSFDSEAEFQGIRPEYIEVSDSGIPVKIVEDLFLGAHRLLIAEKDGNEILIRMHPSAALPAKPKIQLSEAFLSPIVMD